MGLRPIAGGLTLNRDEWLSALGESARPCEPDALTVWELMQMFDVRDRSTMQRRVRQLVGEGKARRTFKIFNDRRMPAYVLVKPDSTKRSKK